MQYREYQSNDLPPAQPASELASPWMRLVAVIIDILIYVGVSIIAVIVGLLLFPEDAIFSSDDLGTEANMGFIILVAGANIVTFIVQCVLLGTRGQTIGKIALSIRIVDTQTGDHPGWARLVLLRAILNGILTSVPFLGFIYFLVDSLFIFREDHKTIHDLYSGTRVDRVTN